MHGIPITGAPSRRKLVNRMNDFPLSLSLSTMHVRLLAYYAPNIIIYIHTVLLIDCRFGRTQKPNNWIQKTNETINTSIVDWDMVLFLKAEAICQLYRESSTVYGLQFNCSPLSTSLLRILSFSFDFYPLRIVGWYGPRQPSPHCTHTHRTRTRTQRQHNVQVSVSACACFPSTLLFAAYIIILILLCCAT